jgi:hypothetical protein
MKNKNKLIGREYFVPIVVTLLFLSPLLFLKTGPRFFYFILAGAMGWGIGVYLVFSLKEKREKKREKRIFLSEAAIWSYVVLYWLISLFLDYQWLNREYLLSFLLKNLLGCFWLFLIGIKGVQTKQLSLRGFPLTKRASVVHGVLMIILSLLILFSNPLIKIFGGLN